jgi:integrase
MTPKKRRQYGSGSVYQRASDGRWLAVIQAGWNASGSKRTITVSATTEAECKRRLAKKQQELARTGVPSAGVSNRVSVKSWAETWLTHTQTKLRPKAYATDCSAVRKWIVPTIGQKRLDALTPGDIRAVSVAIRQAGLTSSTALRAHIILTKMLKAAVLEGHQVPQRVLMVEAPTKSISDRDAIELEDAIKILKTAATLQDGSRWVAALLQGMRQGECLGLTWELVDLDAGTLDVSWQLQALNFAHGCGMTCGRRFGGDCPKRHHRVPDGYEYRVLDGALCLVRPKTERGQRIIPLVPFMAEMLRLWQTIAPRSPHGLVWPRPDGRPRTSKDDKTAWNELQIAAGVTGPGRPWFLHESRHTCATLLLDAGTDPEVVKAILGHSSIVTSRLYQHTSQAMTRKALDGIAERLQLTAGR